MGANGSQIAFLYDLCIRAGQYIDIVSCRGTRQDIVTDFDIIIS